MWIRYQPENSVHTGWLENSLRQFQTTLLDSVASHKGGHAPLSRSGQQVIYGDKMVPKNRTEKLVKTTTRRINVAF